MTVRKEVDFVDSTANFGLEDGAVDLSASSAQLPPEAAAGMMALFGGFLLVILILGIAVYIYYAICLMKIAEKTKTPNGWFAWIPVMNFILMLDIAKRPRWWALSLILAFIPFVNFVAGIVIMVLMVIIWMDIAVKLNKPNWWGILMIVPIVNLIVPGYLAFSKNGSKPQTA